MNRKDDHIKLAQSTHSDIHNDFDGVRFIHSSLTNVDVSDVDLTTSIGDIVCEVPFFINAMTGGSEWTKTINKQLAQVAHATGLLMASGSMSMAIKDTSTLDSFRVIREENPNGILIANLQAGASLSSTVQAVEWLHASALQLHVNTTQELLMDEGDRKFKHWLENIKHLVEKVSVPIIVKEVGFGFSKVCIQQLVDVGVKTIDISGRNGTNFAYIENMRSDFPMEYLNDWGQSTVESLLEAQQYVSQINIIASGGVRSMLDVAKALALGAKAVGISALILNLVLDHGVTETIRIINQYKNQLAKIMCLLGVRRISEFSNCELLLDSKLIMYAQQRGLDISVYSDKKIATK